jgi:multidrug efflux pump
LEPASQDLRVGGRTSNAQYQYTLLSDSAETLYAWTPKLVDALQHNTALAEASSAQRNSRTPAAFTPDRDLA